MAQIDIVCRDCGHASRLVTRIALRGDQKRCEACGSATVRQTFISYLRNGALSDPACGAPQASARGYG